MRATFKKVIANNPLPSGTLPVGIGLLTSGFTSYLFLVLAGRALGPERYGALSVLWALVFMVAPGFFFPLEQEVSRSLSARLAKQLGAGSLISRAIAAGALMLVVLLLVTFALSQFMLERLFDDQFLLLVGFELALFSYALAHLGRGVLSGYGRFQGYGVLLASEGVFRLLACVVLFLSGVELAGPYGFLVGVSPLIALAITFARERNFFTPGPDAPWAELSGALGYLLAGSILSQVLLNGAAVAVKLLASQSQAALVGHFLAGLIISRVPLFFFQAVQASVLPKLTKLAASGLHSNFRSALRRLLYVVSGIAVIATLGAALVGPQIFKLLFGPEFELSRRDLVLLVAGNALFMIAMALAQALISLSAHQLTVVGWGAGLVGFVFFTLTVSELLLRVELGLFLGALMAVTTMGVLLLFELRKTPLASVESLTDATLPVHQIVEL